MEAVQWIAYFVFASCCTEAVVSQCERKEYYVASYGTDNSSCLEPFRPDFPCQTLWYGSTNFADCATIMILDNLIVERSAFFDDRNETRIIGFNARSEDRTVSLTCAGNVGLEFYQTTGITLEYLRFLYCAMFKGFYYGKYVDYGSIAFVRSSNLMMEACSFLNSEGAALVFLDYYGNITIKYSQFTGDHKFDYLRAGGIVYRQSNYVEQSDSTILISNCRFINNTNPLESQCSETISEYGQGGAIEVSYLDVTGIFRFGLSITIEYSTFFSNTAREGGAISINYPTNVSLSLVNTVFLENRALCEGGAVFFGYAPLTDSISTLTVTNYCEFRANSAAWGGGLAVIVDNCKECSSLASIELSDSQWISNTASTSGFAVAVKGPKSGINIDNENYNLLFNLSGNNCLLENYGNWDGAGAIAVENSFVEFSSEAETRFNKNNGTAIALKNCQTVFEGKAVFTYNSGILGGAILVDGNSVLSFGPACNVSFHSNSVIGLGGAIYSGVSEYCTFNVGQMTNISLVSFGPNSAGLSDQSIYLESISECENIKELLDHFGFLDPSAKSISLPIDYVNVTVIDEDNNEVLSSQEVGKVKLGQRFYVRPSVRDELDMEAIGIGYVTVEPDNYQLLGPNKINVDGYTSNIEFSIRGEQVLQDTPVTLSVAYQRSGVLDIKRVTTNLVVAPCVASQEYSDVDQICKCKDYSDNAIQCSDTNDNVCIRKYYWPSENFNSSYPCPALNCMYTTGKCPYNNHYDNCSSNDFCIVEISDDVCQANRTDFLCSQCVEDNAFTFGAFYCVDSSTCRVQNMILLLLGLLAYWVLLLFAFMLILSLKISIGSGFMFGIIYYFSVASIYIRSSAVLGSDWIQILMYINAAIALLDPGVLGYFKVCFVEQWKTPLPHELLRLATPLFLMMSVVIFIIVARFRLPRRFSISEKSPIHAICLLILLSYTSVSYTSWKLLAPLHLSDGTYRVQAAPTVEYYHNDYIPYYVLALLIQLFICIPICLFFLISPFLSTHVNLVKLRLKPIVDEFHACYKPEYRWFAGFYFLARQMVYLISMIFTESHPQNNSYLTTVNVLVLLTHAIAQPYSKKWLNIIDTILLSDIVILSLWSPEENKAGKWGNEQIHDYVIPYALIIIPTMYLLLSLCTVLFKKLIFDRCQRRCYRAHSDAKVIKLTGNSSQRRDGFQLKSSTPSVVSRISNNKYREPLLEDLDTKMENDGSNNYGSM